MDNTRGGSVNATELLARKDKSVHEMRCYRYSLWVTYKDRFGTAMTDRQT